MRLSEHWSWSPKNLHREWNGVAEKSGVTKNPHPLRGSLRWKQERSQWHSTGQTLGASGTIHVVTIHADRIFYPKLSQTSHHTMYAHGEVCESCSSVVLPYWKVDNVSNPTPKIISSEQHIHCSNLMWQGCHTVTGEFRISNFLTWTQRLAEWRKNTGIIGLFCITFGVTFHHSRFISWAKLYKLFSFSS